MKPNKLSLLGAALLSTSAMALDASSLKLQVYSVMLSTSPLCTNPYKVFSSTTPKEVDFLGTPTLGSGSPADGTYECVIIKMSDLIKFTPTSSEGLCVGGREYTADVCRSDNGGMTQAPGTGGAPTPCSGTDAQPAPDAVYLYLTTNKSAGVKGGNGNTFMPPADVGSANGLHLTDALVISGTSRSKFVVNATGVVGSDGSSCGMNPPVFGFKNLP